MQEIEPPKEELASKEKKDSVQSSFTCKTYARSELVPPPTRYRQIVVLREGDGYLDVEPQGTKEQQAFPRNLTLYQAKTGKAITLPMTWDANFSPLDVVYSAFRDAYVLRPRAPPGAPPGINQSWPKNQPLTTYLLWTDGRVETASIPYSPIEYLGSPRPIRAGWIYGGGRYPKTAGLYLFDGKKVSKLDSGGVAEIAVSPDGCKAAVAIQNKPFEMGTPINLKIFNLCMGAR